MEENTTLDFNGSEPELDTTGHAVAAEESLMNEPEPASEEIEHPAVLSETSPTEIAREPFDEPSRVDVNARPRRDWSRYAVPLALGLILLLGAVFRFTGVNWDENQHLHPDERFLTMVETAIQIPKSVGGYLDTAKSPLNPYNNNFGTFVYGTFPLFLVRFIGEFLSKAGYDQIYLVGRYMSGLFDLLTVLIIFFIGRRLYDTRVGLLAALFVAASVLDIQQSHFFTVDTFANVPLVLAFWYTLDVAQGRGGWRSFILAGAFFGLSLAARINLAPFAGILALAAVMRLVNLVKEVQQVHVSAPALQVSRTFAFAADALAQSGDAALAYPERTTRVVRLGPVMLEVEATRKSSVAIAEQEQVAEHVASTWLNNLTAVAIGMMLAALAAFVVFRLAQPYAFKGLLGLNPKFLSDISYVRDLIGGQVDYPPGHQWTDRTPYVFPWVNMVLWGLGPALGIAGWLGFAFAGVEMVRSHKWQHLLAFMWVGGLFLYMGQQFALTDRYFLPLYPFLALFAAYFLIWLWDQARASFANAKGNARPGFRAAARTLSALALIVTVGYTIFWAAAFTTIYTRPVSRIAASRWIYQNISPGTFLGNEHWDDPIPMRVDNKDGFSIYHGVELKLYDEDTPEKREQMVQWLDQVDYIFETSNRLYASIPRLPLRYPLATKYYEWLFDGQLGFELDQTFTSRPKFLGVEINDDNAEESFTVYDHPKVLMFKKSASYSHENTLALLNGVDLSRLVRQKPLDYALSHGAYQLTPADAQADYKGGTWSDIFNPDDFVNRVPVAVWLLLLEVLGLVAFPITFTVLRALPDRGYAFAKSLGVLALGWGAWTLASYHLLPFSRLNIALVLLALVIVSLVVALRQWRAIAAFARRNIGTLLFEEFIFLAFFSAFLLIRMGNPDLWHPSFGGEKPMDFAYLNAAIKTTWFPAYDPWFAGGYINYYYFGQVVSATLVRFTGVVPEVAYNLLLPMYFGLTALGAFGVAFNLVVAAGNRQLVVSDEDAEGTSAVSRRRALVAGLLAAIFVLVLGNLGELGVVAKAAMSLGQSTSSRVPGFAGLYSFFTGAVTWIVSRKTPPISTGDYYWTATRVIPETINEFPFFTFLYADLHAHLMSLAFTLVALAFAVHAVLIRARFKMYDLVVLALVLGGLRAMNTWDYPTYLAVIGAAMVIGFYVGRSRGDEASAGVRELIERYLCVVVLAFIQILLLVVSTNSLGVKVTTDVATYALILIFAVVLGSSVVGWNVDPRRIVSAIGWRFVALVALGIALYWPFVSNYGTAYSNVELWKDKRTSLQDYLIVHGIFLFFVGTYLIVENLRARQRATADGETVATRAESTNASRGILYVLPALAVLDLALIVFNLRVFAFVLPLVALGVWLVLRRDETPIRRLIGLLMLVALLMTLVVEGVTLKGDIGRMNTVFKFYLQAWVMFGVSAAAGVALIADRLLPKRSRTTVSTSQSVLIEPERLPPADLQTTELLQPVLQPATAQPAGSQFIDLKRAWIGFAGLLLFVGLLYPIFATAAKVRDRFVPTLPPGLNGMDYMREARYAENGHEFPLGGDYDAIQWLRENVKGSPVIAEGNAGLYHWGDRVSINTGLPTIIGWDWHTKQQYSLMSGEVIDRRLEDLKSLYNTPDAQLALTLLHRYNVSYVYVGQMERAIYDARGLSKFDALAQSGKLETVYDDGGTKIYRVTDAANAFVP